MSHVPRSPYKGLTARFNLRPKKKVAEPRGLFKGNKDKALPRTKHRFRLRENSSKNPCTYCGKPRFAVEGKPCRGKRP